ncbi:hypothetical protein CC85DRAFT_282036 [Cutaneotrichosporon oleaginosum]|uniref:Uncharacterized protein n=1 Tax=Cutaneotrichosporon oleaginosum TaxID=879819 RepID=A0A0J0XXU2_9TREE|nr:uncharacterized protein CC85DRAFT_282036 [Cutaneotrichosporon oleaginosum]KLT45886.1 hypothetical protein CC85DRAFT_282036 [Cutaneotrichosporon oleaginosum]TXT06587.1 hypothetical protein COLE_05918 [Cutaneotrichosporon oleaginosum]
MSPTIILPGHTYIHISSHIAPAELSERLSDSPVKLEYRGPVGELEGEHVFEVVGAAESNEWKRDGEHVLRSLRERDGITGANVLEPKQRVKRDEF